MISLLIVDDHVMFREGLKQILARHADMQVSAEAGSGQEALVLIRERRFDVIVLDISMPGRSGLDIMADIRAARPDTPVLVLSMHPEDQYAMRTLKAGAAGFLTKESAASDLITAIRKLAGGGRYVSPFLAETLASALQRDTHAGPAHEALSNREFQVLRMLGAGRTLREIADELILSEKTITTYRTRILDKLGLRNNVELARYVLEHHILE